MGEGLGLWPDAVVDQHFSERNREPRLRAVVMQQPKLPGIGIDESTYVLVAGDELEVGGKGQVTVLDARWGGGSWKMSQRRGFPAPGQWPRGGRRLRFAIAEQEGVRPGFRVTGTPAPPARTLILNRAVFRVLAMPHPSSSTLSRREFLRQSGLGVLAAGVAGRATSVGAAESKVSGAARWARAVVNRFHVQKIWSDGRHNAFPGIARFGEHLYVALRNSKDHQTQDGSARIQVIRSAADDLEKWEKVAEFGTDRDARDPLIFDNRGRLQVVYHDREDFYAQSADGHTWSTPKMLEAEFVAPPPGLTLSSQRRWLFRIRRGPDGAFYSLARCGIKVSGTPGKFGLILYRSEDGVVFKAMHTYGEGPITGLPPGRGYGHEADVAWAGDGTFLAAIRNSRNDGVVVAGPPPHGPFRPILTGSVTFGGPALHTTKKGGVLVAGRHRDPESQLSYCRVSTVLPDKVENSIILPSGGDCAYQSFVDGPGDTVYLVYYSSHEYPQAKGAGRTPANLYLAHLTIRHEP